MSKNVYIVPRENPLILEIRVESDVVQNGLAAVTPASLQEIRRIVRDIILERHYKLLIVDVAGIQYGGSSLMAKFLMCYEKASSVKCSIVTVNMDERLYAQGALSGLNELVPGYLVKDSPKPEEYDTFFKLGRDADVLDATLEKNNENSLEGMIKTTTPPVEKNEENLQDSTNTSLTDLSVKEEENSLDEIDPDSDEEPERDISGEAI